MAPNETPEQLKAKKVLVAIAVSLVMLNVVVFAGIEAMGGIPTGSNDSVPVERSNNFTQVVLKIEAGGNANWTGMYGNEWTYVSSSVPSNRSVELPPMNLLKPLNMGLGHLHVFANLVKTDNGSYPLTATLLTIDGIVLAQESTAEPNGIINLTWVDS